MDHPNSRGPFGMGAELVRFEHDENGCDRASVVSGDSRHNDHLLGRDLLESIDALNISDRRALGLQRATQPMGKRLRAAMAGPSLAPTRHHEVNARPADPIGYDPHCKSSFAWSVTSSAVGGTTRSATRALILKDLQISLTLVLDLFLSEQLDVRDVIFLPTASALVLFYDLRHAVEAFKLTSSRIANVSYATSEITQMASNVKGALRSSMMIHDVEENPENHGDILIQGWSVTEPLREGAVVAVTFASSRLRGDSSDRSIGADDWRSKPANFPASNADGSHMDPFLVKGVSPGGRTRDTAGRQTHGVAVLPDEALLQQLEMLNNQHIRIDDIVAKTKSEIQRFGSDGGT
ncbi:hypothetical protein HK101_007498 [Irineochytrium annulatum]|nr:hypothetical protein HK101_007498 [Irineochytrium annulatum]